MWTTVLERHRAASDQVNQPSQGNGLSGSLTATIFRAQNFAAIDGGPQILEFAASGPSRCPRCAVTILVPFRDGTR